VRKRLVEAVCLFYHSFAEGLLVCIFPISPA
jgi:hypothetical protein